MVFLLNFPKIDRNEDPSLKTDGFNRTHQALADGTPDLYKHMKHEIVLCFFLLSLSTDYFSLSISTK